MNETLSGITEAAKDYNRIVADFAKEREDTFAKAVDAIDANGKELSDFLHALWDATSALNLASLELEGQGVKYFRNSTYLDSRLRVYISCGWGDVIPSSDTEDVEVKWQIREPGEKPLAVQYANNQYTSKDVANVAYVAWHLPECEAAFAARIKAELYRRKAQIDVQRSEYEALL